MFSLYLADTDITDILLADTNMADSDIQYADTDISVSANYICKPIYWSIPTTDKPWTRPDKPW